MPIYDLYAFKDGVIRFRDANTEGEGLLGKGGAWVVEPTYVFLGECSDGLARFSTTLGPEGYEVGPYGFLSCG